MYELKINAEIDLSYESNAERHYVNAVEHLNSALEFKQILCGLLELRLCIERLCFEYLALLTHEKRELVKSELNKYKPSDFKKLIYREEPHFEKKIDFINCVFISQHVNRKMLIPDFEWLNTIYGKTNDFLHLQKHPLNDIRKSQIINELPQIMKTLKSYILDRGSIHELRPHAQMILDKYIANEIDIASMQKMLDISNIPIHLLNDN